MIYSMAKDIAEALQGGGFPIAVLYGPERFERQHYDNKIVIARDRQGGDGFRPPQGQQANPHMIGVRDQGVVLRIYAKSSTPHAVVFDHEHLCDQFLDAVTVALEEWHKAARTGGSVVGMTGRYLGKEDRSGEDEWPGVVYEARFRVPRGVVKRNYKGEARTEVPLTAIAHENRTDVRRVGQTDIEPPAVGCETVPATP